MGTTAGKFGMLAVALVLLCAVALVLMLSVCVGAPRAGALAAPTLLPATATATESPESTPSPPPAAPVPTEAPVAVPRITGASADIRSAQAAAPIVPLRLRIESVGIDMTIESVGLGATGGMGLPKNPATAAWYRFGPGPTSAAGAAVIAAHVDSLEYDIGPFSRLAAAPAGTEIILSLADGSERRYSIDGVGLTLKPDVSWSAVFDRTGSARLTLVTCGGEFDYTAKRYLSNVIVSAVVMP